MTVTDTASKTPMWTQIDSVICVESDQSQALQIVSRALKILKIFLMYYEVKSIKWFSKCLHGPK